MVRLMLVLAPVMCILSGIAVSGILSIYMKVCYMIPHILSSHFVCYRISRYLIIKSRNRNALIQPIH